jgi:hypothetical protein
LRSITGTRSALSHRHPVSLRAQVHGKTVQLAPTAIANGKAFKVVFKTHLIPGGRAARENLVKGCGLPAGALLPLCDRRRSWKSEQT